MKKIAIATLLATAALSASAADFVQINEERAQGRQGASDSNVTYLRAGKDFGPTSLGFQSRTARFDAGGVATSLEATVSDKRVTLLGVTPFIGAGHDFSHSGFNYGLVGATTGFSIGPGFVYAGAKMRVLREHKEDPRQLVTFAGYSLPVNKAVALDLGISRSDRDIKENATTLGLRFNF